MKTSDRIELVRSVVLSEFGPHVEVAKLLSLIWKDEVVNDYLRQNGIDLDPDKPRSIEELIAYGVLYFLTTNTRENGTEFVMWSEDTPEFLSSHLREVHKLDDWRYSKLEEMAQGFIEDPYGDYFMIDMDPDIYTSDLMKWLGSDQKRHGYVQQVEFQSKIMSVGGSFFDLLQYAQTLEIQEMGQQFVRTLEEMAESFFQ